MPINKAATINEWVTFPAPEQFVHLFVVGARNGWSEEMDSEMGSMFKHTPLAEQRAQAKYPAHIISHKLLVVVMF